jgi:hypothetical protein
MKRKIIIVIAGIICSTQMQAQRLHNLYGFSWEVSFPAGTEFIDKVSYAGGRFEYRHFIKENLSVGGAISWNNFGQYVSRQTYENADQTQAITTDMYRTVFNLPMTVNAHYYFGGGVTFKPYVGLGLGAQYSDQEAYYNIFISEDENWGFIARPEIGTLINLGSTGGFRMMLGGGYNYSTNSNSSFRIDNLSTYWVSVGIAFVN